ncbi:MAG: T9SS type A sorting domain-containing protein [Flavobacteriales bacterium]|nr:T9SS type A sorting domain-containing protein [Flavobacteriales bacterium]
MNVQLPGDNGGTLELLDLSGRRLRSWPARGNASSTTLDLRDLSKGSYMVVYRTDGGENCCMRLVLR